MTARLGATCQSYLAACAPANATPPLEGDEIQIDPATTDASVRKANETLKLNSVVRAEFVAD